MHTIVQKITSRTAAVDRVDSFCWNFVPQQKCSLFTFSFHPFPGDPGRIPILYESDPVTKDDYKPLIVGLSVFVGLALLIVLILLLAAARRRRNTQFYNVENTKTRIGARILHSVKINRRSSPEVDLSEADSQFGSTATIERAIWDPNALILQWRVHNDIIAQVMSVHTEVTKQ